MDSGMVREVIASILEREEYMLDNARNNNLRAITRKLLDEVVVAEKTELFDEFAEQLVVALKNTFPNSPPPPTMLKEEALRERLWRLFHSLRIGQLPALRQALYAGLVQESMLEQYTNHQLFESLMVTYFEKSNPSHKTRSQELPPLTKEEEDILRYACGYVPYKLLQRFRKQKTEKAAEYAECVVSMAFRGEGEDLPTYAIKWIEQVNRGGLFQVNDQAFSLFHLIELKFRVDMPSILMQLVDKDNLVRKIIDDEDIQFSWSNLSVNIEEEEDSVELLRHIVELWLAIRGKSLAQHMMETTNKRSVKVPRSPKPSGRDCNNQKLHLSESFFASYSMLHNIMCYKMEFNNMFMIPLPFSFSWEVGSHQYTVQPIFSCGNCPSLDLVLRNPEHEGKHCYQGTA